MLSTCEDFGRCNHAGDVLLYGRERGGHSMEVKTAIATYRAETDTLANCFAEWCSVAPTATPAPRIYRRAIPSGVRRMGSDRSSKKRLACAYLNAVSDVSKTAVSSGTALARYDEREEWDGLDTFSGSQITCIFLCRQTQVFVRIVPFLLCEIGLRPPTGGRTVC